MKKWYFVKSINIEILLSLIIFASCNNGTLPSKGANQAPYPVTGPVTVIDYEKSTGIHTLQLEIQEQGGLSDPDGDAVYFKSNIPASVDWISIDEGSGLVTVDTAEAHSSADFSFWSEDELGADTSLEPFILAVTVTAPGVLVFASDRDWDVVGEEDVNGDLEIYSLDLETDELTKLTSNDETDKQPSLSADGTKIAFVSDRSGSWAIYTMDVVGSNVSDALVSPIASYDGHPSWDPDELMIAYDYNYDIYTINTSTKEISNLTTTILADEKEPSWSSDGMKIAYSMKPSGGDYNIYTMDSDGDGSFQLTTDDAIDQEPSWSLDDTQIAFSTNRDGDYDIYTINTDGTLLSGLATNAGDETSPSWSSDGNTIAYVKSGDIYTRNADGSGVETNITNSAFTDQDPSW
jgi:Tol biopolymer transport system component